MFQKKENQGDDLLIEAKKLGVLYSDVFPEREVGASDIASARLQERVRNAKNARYAQMASIVALVSAIASVVSAMAVWCTVFK